MSLEATLPSLEEVPEDLHGEYEKTDDGYRLKILSNYTSNDKIEDISGLKSALQKERDNAKKAAYQLTQFREQFGDVDPEKYQALLQQEEKREEEEALKRGEYDKRLNQVREKQQAELDKRTAREQHLINVIKESKIDAAVISALNEMKGSVNLLLPHVKGKMQLIEEDGQFVARVVDETGTVRVNGEGKPITAKELVSEMRDQDSFAAAFAADVKSGGGTPAGDGSNGARGKTGAIPGDLKRSVMTPRQKVDFIQKFGNDEFLKLPSA